MEFATARKTNSSINGNYSPRSDLAPALRCQIDDHLSAVIQQRMYSRIWTFISFGVREVAAIYNQYDRLALTHHVDNWTTRPSLGRYPPVSRRGLAPQARVVRNIHLDALPRKILVIKCGTLFYLLGVRPRYSLV